MLLATAKVTDITSFTPAYSLHKYALPSLRSHLVQIHHRSPSFTIIHPHSLSFSLIQPHSPSFSVVHHTSASLGIVEPRSATFCIAQPLRLKPVRCSTNWAMKPYLSYTHHVTLHITGIDWTRIWPAWPTRLHTLAQFIEPRTGVAEVMGSNPVGASEFFLGFICNCLSYFTTAKISFTSILYPQFTHMIFIMYTSHQYTIYNNLYIISDMIIINNFHLLW